MNFEFTKRNVIVALIVVVLGFALFNFSKPLFQDKEIFKVETENYQEFVIVTGSVGSRNDVGLIAEESGIVDRITHSAGDTVGAQGVVVQITNKVLAEEYEAQVALLQRERARLQGVVNGPENIERNRILANDDIAVQVLTNEMNIAWATTQQTAGNLEDIIRQKVDLLFDYSDGHYYFRLPTQTNKAITLNQGRDKLETVFERWRASSLSAPTSAESEELVQQLGQFGKDLQQVYALLVDIYEYSISARFASDAGAVAFASLAEVRSATLDAMVKNTRAISGVQEKLVQHQLSRAKTTESLSGGTLLDRQIQQAVVEAETSRLKALEARLEKTRVRAPFAGVVGEMYVEVGEFITQGATVARFVSDGGFEIRADVTEVEIPSVEIGQRMSAYVDALDSEVEVVVRTIDVTEKRISDVPVYTVIFDILNPEREIRPGMTVDVRVPITDEQYNKIVPTEALWQEERGDFVLVQRNNEEVMVPVVIGPASKQGFVSITGDIQEGDAVILNQKPQ